LGRVLEAERPIGAGKAKEPGVREEARAVGEPLPHKEKPERCPSKRERS